MVQEDQTTHEREVKASGETNADATVSNGQWEQTNGIDVQRHNSSAHVRTNNQ